MGITLYAYRKKNKWVVSWKNSWTGKKHTKAFAEEVEAQAFEVTQNQSRHYPAGELPCTINRRVSILRAALNWAVRSIARAWHTALRRAGITRRIRPYDLRHAYATYSLAGGADIGSVARIMGHTDASMILKTYQHVQDAQKRAAVETLPDILLAARSHTQPGLPV